MNPKSQSESRRKKSVRPASATAPQQSTRVAFPSIGIGTAVGGLEASEHFRGHVPRNNELALGIIQHRVAITFADLTAAGTLEAKLREPHGALEPRVADQAQPADGNGDRPSDAPRIT